MTPAGQRRLVGSARRASGPRVGQVAVPGPRRDAAAQRLAGGPDFVVVRAAAGRVPVAARGRPCPVVGDTAPQLSGLRPSRRDARR